MSDLPPLPLTDEAAARAWIEAGLGVSRESMAQLDAYVALLRDENLRQNLIAASTAGDQMWVRHIADSAQLLLHRPEIDAGGSWLDLGSGPGLPGLVIAILAPQLGMTLVESRALRAAFLQRAIAELGLGNRVIVEAQPVARLTVKKYDTISARAFAPLPRLIDMSARFAAGHTLWLLPKGQNAVNELSTLPTEWQRLFHVESSVTDPAAAILVGQGRAQVRSDQPAQRQKAQFARGRTGKRR